MFNSCYKNKKVLVVGHTGFKGSWLVNWLYYLEANIYGLSKKNINRSLNYDSSNVKKKLKKEYDFDVRNFSKLKNTIKTIKPDYIFYLAAQSLVGSSYNDPHETWTINLLGGLNLLEIIKKINFKTNLILITSDKCYENIEKKSGYKESDTLGGSDPYSASKASVEILYKSYFQSYYKYNKKINSATVRAGNVIGGGDVSQNRIIPDCIKSWKNNKKTQIRNPKSTRPWQHVLEPIGGYLLLGSYLAKNKYNGESFNFGPTVKNSKSVKYLINEVKKNLPNFKFQFSKVNSFKEHNLLQLNCKKAKEKLNWNPRLSFKNTVKFTLEWYKRFYKKEDMSDYCIYQIKKFIEYEKKNKNNKK
jgi:CDP-glucose 4,6-dehydratase